jgi:hypothetical protein
MFDALKPFIGSLVRHGVTSAGALLAAQGLTVSATDSETLTGALLVVVGLVWSFVEKKLAAKKAE